MLRATRSTSRPAASSPRSEHALQGVTRTLAVGVLGLALSLGLSAAADTTSAATQADPAPRLDDLVGTPASRPLSADAAERWWLTCTADTPTSPDAAARWIARCW